MLKWEDLPVEMQSSEVESYYQLVSKRRFADFQAVPRLFSGFDFVNFDFPSLSNLGLMD